MLRGSGEQRADADTAFAERVESHTSPGAPGATGATALWPPRGRARHRITGVKGIGKKKDGEMQTQGYGET